MAMTGLIYYTGNGRLVQGHLYSQPTFCRSLALNSFYCVSWVCKSFGSFWVAPSFVLATGFYAALSLISATVRHTVTVNIVYFFLLEFIVRMLCDLYCAE